MGIINVDRSYLDSLVSRLNDDDLLYLAKLVSYQLHGRIEAEEDRYEREADERELAESA